MQAFCQLPPSHLLLDHLNKIIAQVILFGLYIRLDQQIVRQVLHFLPFPVATSCFFEDASFSYSLYHERS